MSHLYVATVSRGVAWLKPLFAAARRCLLILIVDLQHLPKDLFPGPELGPTCILTAAAASEGPYVTLMLIDTFFLLSPVTPEHVNKLE